MPVNRRKRPRVITNCVADAYTRGPERIIEFSHEGKGGLISFRETPDGRLRIEVYRMDPGITVLLPGENKYET